VAPGDELIGRTLGDFRILRRIGAGGMGVVFEAADESLRRTVALKILPAELTDHPERRARFLREARTAAAVTHPCVAAVYQVGTAGDLAFIAMELVTGQSLRARLARGPVPLEEALRITVDMVRGLARAHASGVIHRDLKPENVMLDAEDQVKILDFGLAKPVEADPADAGPAAPVTPDLGSTITKLTVEGRILGTPGYMSPEQSRGGEVDERTDLFAVGVVLYEMLAGRAPFQGDTPIDTIIAVSRDPHVDLARLRPDVPAAVVAIVDRCLAKSPEARYRAASDLLVDLRRVTGSSTPSLSRPLAAATGSEPDDGIGVAATLTPADSEVAAALAAASSPRLDAPTVTAAVPPRIRRPRAWAVLAGAAILAMVVAGGLVWRDRARTPARPRARVHAPATSPLTRPDAVLACPILEAAGVEAPAGWLGATAAHVVCLRATTMRGGRTSRTLIPAELLDLPRAPAEDYPKDPYAAPRARDQSIAAARARAAAWIDGRVEITPRGFSLSLVLRRPDGEAVASASGEGRELHQAVRQSTDALARSGELPRSDRQEEPEAVWSSLRSTTLALAVQDWELSQYNGPGLAGEVKRLEAHAQALGQRWPLIQSVSARNLGSPPPRLTAPPPERAGVPGEVRTLVTRAWIDPAADRAAIAGRLAELRAQAGDGIARAFLGNAAATVWYQTGDHQRARQIGLAVAAEAPRLVDWSLVTGGAYQQPGFEYAARAAAAWTPHNPDVWSMLGYGESKATADERIRMGRRAVTLAPDRPLWSLNYAGALLLGGQRERVRALAARLATGGAPQQIAAETLLVQVEASEARLGAALARALRTLLRIESFGLIEMADIVLLGRALAVAAILGRAAEVADAFAERFVLGPVPRLQAGDFAVLGVSWACARATRTVAARCFHRLRERVRQGWFREGLVSHSLALLDAGEAWAKGDLGAAARVLRPVVTAGGGVPDYASEVFDRLGETDLASRLDRQTFGRAPGFHGATLSHVREARRAAAAGDTPRARELAETVVGAWSVADVPVPAVAEMRALLGRLPARAPR
jgi:serine/threonine protein kinase